MDQPAAEQGRRFVAIQQGDPAPWFQQRTSGHPKFSFDSAAGRYIVMLFIVTAADAAGKAAADAVLAHGSLFDDAKVTFFAVTTDPRDESEKRLCDRVPGIRHFWDYNGEVSRLYGSIPVDSKVGDANLPARRFWLVLDPTLRVMAVFPFAEDGRHNGVFDYIRSLPPPGRIAGIDINAPVIVLPNVFEPDLCCRLIDLYESHGGTASGFMQEVDGKTVVQHNANRKVRKDYLIQDPELIKLIQWRIQRRVAPEIQKVHCFNPTRMERHVVCCYSADDGGHFFAHRDNTTKGTAHRRFAVSINLNGDFDGGELSFPEYGPKGIKIPVGAAVVFSCSLLHAVSKVTRGRRYAFLPFLYDDAAAQIRAANNEHLGEGVAAYIGA